MLHVLSLEKGSSFLALSGNLIFVQFFCFWTCLFCLPFLSIFLSILPLKRCAGKKPNPLVHHMKTRLFKNITSAFFHYLATAASAAGQKQKAWRITFPIDFHAAQYFWRWGRGCRFPRSLPPPFPHAKRRQGPFVIFAALWSRQLLSLAFEDSSRTV